MDGNKRDKHSEEEEEREEDSVLTEPAISISIHGPPNRRVRWEDAVDMHVDSTEGKCTVGRAERKTGCSALHSEKESELIS